MTRGLAGRLDAQGGYSLLELVVAAGIFGVLAAAGLPHIDTRRQALNSSVERTVADLRFARARAITTGDHFAVAFSGAGSYEVQRLQLVGQEWTVAEVVKTVDLPSHIEWMSGGVSEVEFNTRGMMISASAPLWPSAWDTLHNQGRQVSIWPSGQIYVED